MVEAKTVESFVSMLNTAIGFGTALYYLNLSDNGLYAGYVFPKGCKVDDVKKRIMIDLKSSKYHPNTELTINYSSAVVNEKDDEENGTSFEFLFNDGTIISLADLSE